MLIGTTGSGKTTALRALLKQMRERRGQRRRLRPHRRLCRGVLRCRPRYHPQPARRTLPVVVGVR
ncbi:type IV secretion system DNA-binding domain-containing protein [Sphingomonas panni]